MIDTGKAKSGRFTVSSALAAVLALGMVAGAAVTSEPAFAAKKKKKAAKMKFSKNFVKVAGPAQTAFAEAKADPAVLAAQTQVRSARQSRDTAQITSARSAMNAALSDELVMLEQVFGAIEKEEDRFLAGSLAVQLGGTSLDQSLQSRGLKAMVASGKTSPADTQRFNAIVGQIAYQSKDYAEAIRYLKPAVDAGYTKDNSSVILAESYIANNQVALGLGMMKSALTAGRTSGTLAPESWYRRGIASAYKAGMINEAAEFGGMFLMDYPTEKNAGLALTIVREMGNFGSQETLDLMRLMGRTNSYAEQRDYVEYIQAADPRRLPGETLDVINAGISSGSLTMSDTFVSDTKSQASGRIAGDKASLPAYERDARNPGANEGTVSGAADAMLSYGMTSSAESLYEIALTKPGVDANRALTRLGISQVDQAKYTEAQATFGKVTGPRKSIAILWSAYAKSKVAPAPAPAAVAPVAAE